MDTTLEVNGYQIVNDMPVYADLSAKRKAEQAAVKSIGVSCARLRRQAGEGQADDRHLRTPVDR